MGAVAALTVVGAFLPSDKTEDTVIPDPHPIVEKAAEQQKTEIENQIAETGSSVSSETSKEEKKTPVDLEPAFREQLMKYAYVGSAESDKYDETYCRWVKDINDKNLVHFENEEDASAAGYQPCGTCKP